MAKKDNVSRQIQIKLKESSDIDKAQGGATIIHFYCDSDSTIVIFKNPIFHRKTNHILR